MARDEPITYEQLPAEHKQRYDEIKAQFEADLIGSFEGPATTVSSGRVFTRRRP
jgi:hypothetical protein